MTRRDLLPGLLDMLILRTLQWGSQHGHGIGQALLERLGGLAVQRGCGRFEWSVLDWNANAIRFWIKAHRPCWKNAGASCSASR